MNRWSEIRSRLASGELSKREASEVYKLNYRTINKIESQAEPVPMRFSKSREKPVLGPYLSIIQDIVQGDLQSPRKQRHTARRIFERLRDEHGYTGCPSIVRDAVRQCKQTQAEVFVPLEHRPGQAQCDFGHAEVLVAGQPHTAGLFVMTLPFSHARFVCAFPRECTETFQAGHVAAFNFFCGVPNRISYDNTRIAVSRRRGKDLQLSSEFLRLRSYFCFESHFCNPRKPQEKGHVENGVGYVRRNFLVPIRQADSWEALNEALAGDCRREQQRIASGQQVSTAALLQREQAAFLKRPEEPFQVRHLELITINCMSLGRFDGNDYSVPTAMAYKSLSASGDLDWVRFSYRGEQVACHRRCWDKRQVILEPLHYLALLQRKPGALDHAKPLAGWKLPEAFATLRRRLEEIDPKEGTRKYIGVLRLLEKHDQKAVSKAIERVLSLKMTDADGIRLVLEQALEQPASNFDLTGRPGLQAIELPGPDLTAYDSLSQNKEVKT